MLSRMEIDATPVPNPPPVDPEATAPSGASAFEGIGGIKSKRELLSVQELLDGLTKLMRACEGCEKVTVIRVDRLDKADSRDGCNWSLSIVLEPAGVAPEVYGLAYGLVIGQAREIWNLQEPKQQP